MNRRIEVSLARYGWDVDEERVTVTTASGTTVLYDADDGTGDEQVATEYIDAALAEGPWLLRFAGTPGDFPVGAGTASDWATYATLTEICKKFTLTAVDERPTPLRLRPACTALSRNDFALAVGDAA